MTRPLSPAAFAALQNLSTATVCNAIEQTALRLRNEGYVGEPIRLRTPLEKPMVGYAITLHMRTDAPPVSGSSYLDRTDWWEAFSTSSQPKIVVIEDTGGAVGVGSVAGETHLQIFRALGAVGLVTNGAVRDLRGLDRLGVPVFSKSVVPSHGYAHIVTCGAPASIGGLTIQPGDLLHGDEDGVTTIPLEIAEELPAIAAKLQADERKIVAICQGSRLTPAQLKIALTEILAARRT
jgi:regulator of RNase E activity RraA